MNKITLKYKVFFVAMLGIIVASIPVIANAVNPAPEGTIYACKVDSDGQLKYRNESANCQSGESPMQWDRGIIGYAYKPQAISSDVTNFTKGNVPVSMSYVFYDNMTNICVNLPADVMTELRFVTVNGAANDLVLRGDGIDSAELDDKCGTEFEGLLKSQYILDETTLLFY